ncbi:protein ANKUB1-like [Stylophora pistillata]|uniref:protein ANKUB1-like n=1 Tax=Stylophora pistillata TaxID=50429 RepID=UPI000C0463C2|nr:protein ANKUB1-like [Stylophora pistillata]
MRIFVLFDRIRHLLDVEVGQTVSEIKGTLRKKLDLDTVQSEDGENDMLMAINYAGSNLEDDWVFTDISIPPGATLRCELLENVKTYLSVTCSHLNETLKFTEWFDVWETKVGHFKTMITEKTGLHVSVFRLVSLEGKEMYDCHPLKKYSVDYGDTIRLEIWNGWGAFLKSATSGQLTPTIKHMVSIHDDPLVFKYQLRVALFIAAHFNYTQLATQLIKSGARCDEPVGEHPVREWCNKEVHPDHLKTPVHEAAQHGSLNCLQKFIHHNYACILAKDAHGLTPCNIARRYRKTECFKLLIAEQFRSRSTCGLTLGIYWRVRKWCERARDRAIVFHKHSPNPLLLAMENRTYRSAVVGQKVQVDGFGENMQTGTSKIQLSLELKSVKNKPTAGGQSGTSLKSIHSDKYGNSSGSVEIMSFHEKGDSADSGNYSSESSEESNNDRATCADCLLPSVSKLRSHGDISKLETSIKHKLQIKNANQERRTANQHKAYRWREREDSEIVFFCQSSRHHKEKQTDSETKTDQRESMPLISTNTSLVGVNKSDKNIDIQIIDESGNQSAHDFFVTQEVAVSSQKKPYEAKNTLKEETNESADRIPPIKPPSDDLSLNHVRIDISSATKSVKSSKTDGMLLKQRRRTLSLHSTPKRLHSANQRRRANSSEDLSLQLTRMYSRVTGQDMHEAAKESMGVAMTFRKKRWLQQVHMAIELNNNNFNRQLHGYKGKYGAGHVS